MDESLRSLVRERALGLGDFVVTTRRDIHAHPELGNQEKRTPARIVEVLNEAGGFEIRTGVGGTGVVAVLRGTGDGKTLALRADMDALPLDETASDRPYRSCVPGVMHACGHDGHVAMALGAARLLGGMRDRLRGNVVFLFQPAEETYGGASEMIADGCLTGEPRVDGVFGLHLEPLHDVGELRLKSGPIMASADAFRILVQGKGGHASEPHDCIDPVPVAAQLVINLQTLVTRCFDAKSPVVITPTYLQAGSAFNVIPEEAVVAGTVRTVDPDVRARVGSRIEQLARHTAEAFGASAEVSLIAGSGVVVNHADFVDFVRSAVGASARVIDMPQAVMGAEDFGCFTEHVPGAFAFLGARPSHQEAYPCHHPQFDIDERALPLGVEILATVALEYLKD